jgi:hypothetical protein
MRRVPYSSGWYRVPVRSGGDREYSHRGFAIYVGAHGRRNRRVHWPVDEPSRGLCGPVALSPIIAPTSDHGVKAKIVVRGRLCVACHGLPPAALAALPWEPPEEGPRFCVTEGDGIKEDCHDLLAYALEEGRQTGRRRPVKTDGIRGTTPVRCATPLRGQLFQPARATGSTTERGPPCCGVG